jgi:hypothetical protein
MTSVRTKLQNFASIFFAAFLLPSPFLLAQSDPEAEEKVEKKVAFSSGPE